MTGLRQMEFVKHCSQHRILASAERHVATRWLELHECCPLGQEVDGIVGSRISGEAFEVRMQFSWCRLIVGRYES